MRAAHDDELAIWRNRRNTRFEGGNSTRAVPPLPKVGSNSPSVVYHPSETLNLPGTSDGPSPAWTTFLQNWNSWAGAPQKVTPFSPRPD